jgi:leader peptidase (prepilin peptidase)/N-methyltransferase
LEVTTGFLVLLPFVYSNTWLVLCAWQVFTIIGLALTLIDARHKKLPNGLTIGLLVIVLVLLGTDSLLSGSFAEFKRAILISCLTFSLFLAISLVSNGGLGMGDVKFLASISLLSGYISGFTVYVSIMIALVLASVFSIYQVIVKGAGRKTSIPLGPFLYFGAVLGPMFTTFVHNFILG